MEILRTVAALRAWSRGERSDGETVGLVPTMGALHAGHASLIEAAARLCGRVAVSIFVNPTQFGPNEDFARYPRSFEADCRLAEAAGAHVVFAPAVEEIYPGMIGGGAGDSVGTFVEVAELSERLDGKSRPGHFRGVAMVVAKLLIACEADKAFFGQKDAAQVAVLRRMVLDLRIGTEIVVCPIVRESNGLAMSSRNVYLSVEERKQALVLSRAVQHMEWLIRTGEHRAEVLKAGARSVFAAEPDVRIDYIEVVDWGTLEPVAAAWKGTLIAVAAWVGATRLIDNAVIS
jgi:pantoate--beta-alanine ligase